MNRPYVRPWKASGWWLTRPTWLRYMVRELTAVFVAGYAVFLLVLVGQAASEKSFAVLIQKLKSPGSIILHILVIVFAIYHAVTWFSIATAAVPLRRGEDRVSPALINVVLLAAWAAVSALILWAVIRQV